MKDLRARQIRHQRTTLGNVAKVHRTFGNVAARRSRRRLWWIPGGDIIITRGRPAAAPGLFDGLAAAHRPPQPTDDPGGGDNAYTQGVTRAVFRTTVGRFPMKPNVENKN